MIEQTLRQTFGYDSLRPGQEQAIRAVVAGRSAAAIFPTGSGKSLCYQLPALLLPHLTLVVSPLLALMQDQLAFLHRHGIAAASIDSAQSREQTSETMARAKSGELKILMISVERLKNERFRHFISQVPISCWWWTRRTASPSGATTFARTISSSPTTSVSSTFRRCCC